MAFTAQRQRDNDNLIEAGEYEVYLSFCGETTTKSGKKCVKFDFVIRDDVEQKYRKKHIFKTFTYGDDGCLSQRDENKIGAWANGLGVEVGEEFNLVDLEGRSCRIVYKHFTTENGEKIGYIGFIKESLEPPAIQTFDEIDDDAELPF